MRTIARTWLNIAVLGAGMISATSCLSGSDSDQAPAGTERGACRTDGTCDSGLSCLSDVCVNAGGIGGTGATSGGTSGGSPPAATAGDTGVDSAGGSTSMDPPTGDAGETGEGGSSNVPTDLECRTEASYLICAHAAVTWSQARSYCQSQGGDLVKIDDDAENATLTSALTETGSAWIGANDIDAEGEFVWPDGTAVSSGETSWAMDQPNDNAEDGEDCVVMHSGAGEWNDVGCSETSFADEGISIICELP